MIGNDFLRKISFSSKDAEDNEFCSTTFLEEPMFKN
jgi:hypothetical protein